MSHSQPNSSALRALLLGFAVLGAGSAHAATSSINLGGYTLTGTFALPGSAPEASAITYNWDTGTLFVLGDEGNALVEVDKASGAQLSVMSLGGFDDTEGLTYIGGGRFVLIEERLQNAYLLTYVAGGGASRGSLQTADLGPTVGNIGIEGISFDPRDGGSFVSVKEKDPQGVGLHSISFGAPSSVSTSPLFDPASLGLFDLSDVQVLATVPAFAGTGVEDHLLVLSQESAKLVETTRSGEVLSFFDLAALSFNTEGVTIDAATGKIYIVAEEAFGNGQPTLYELTPAPVPVPAALPLLASALLGLGAARRRAARG